MRLEEFFKVNNKVALAFSGGVDSAYLLYAALRSRAEVHAYYVKSEFQPQFEMNDALRLAEQLKAEMTILSVDILNCDPVAENPPDRCYYCKRAIFQTIMQAAEADGFSILIDGTNASDEEGDRPGIRALRELCVRSPLRECGLRKEEVRRLSREAGLFTWDKPAYACLATRIPTGEVITDRKLQETEVAEAYLFSLGFTDFRVRRIGNIAKLQIREEQLERCLSHREEILGELKKYYQSVLLDMEVRM